MRLLRAIKVYKAQHDGNAPTRPQMARVLGSSPQSVDILLKRLEVRGLIAFDERGLIMITGGRWLRPKPTRRYRPRAVRQ
jgi:Mn-dependent DtxR family transcriptional regulator